MMRRSAVALLVLVLTCLPALAAGQVYDGLVLYNPINSRTTYLKDTSWQTVRSWTGTVDCAYSAHLMPDSTIWRGDVLRLLGRWLAGLDVDVAFVDPPYALARRLSPEQLTAKLFAPLAGRLAPGGVVVFRCESNIPVPDAFGPLSVRQRRRYGKMTLTFLEAAQATRNTEKG